MYMFISALIGVNRVFRKTPKNTGAIRKVAGGELLVNSGVGEGWCFATEFRRGTP